MSGSITAFAVPSFLQSFLKLCLMSLAFLVGLAAFVLRDSRLRESGESVLLGLFFMSVSTIFSVVSLLAPLEHLHTLSIATAIIAVSSYFLSWLFLLFAFWKAYGRLYHMREKRFWKYVVPFVWIYRLLPKRYAVSMLPRSSFSLRPYDFTPAELSVITKGWSVLFLGDHKADLSSIGLEVILDGLDRGETADYVCCNRSPYEIWATAETLSPDILKKPYRFTIIDAYSPAFGFDDEILKEKRAHLTARRGGVGIHVLPARTVAGIHTACNTSWYINRRKTSGSGPRKPHRMVYDHLSVLAAFSSSGQINNYFYHAVAAERAYGMITAILEDIDGPVDIVHALSEIADCVIHVTVKNGSTALTMTKGRGLDTQKYCSELTRG